MAAANVRCRSRWIALSSSSPTVTPQNASHTFQLAARSASNGNAASTMAGSAAAPAETAASIRSLARSARERKVAIMSSRLSTK